MTNEARDKAAKRLEELCVEKDKVNARAMRRFEQKLSPIFTGEMLVEIDIIDYKINSVCEAIRAANQSETQRDRGSRPKQELPLH